MCSSFLIIEKQDASATKSNFHLDGYAAVIDLPTTSPLLREIFGSNDYFAAGCGGDVVLAGAMAACHIHDENGHLFDDSRCVANLMDKIPAPSEMYKDPLHSAGFHEF